jgi:autotransporter-associated beta strand protein
MPWPRWVTLRRPRVPCCRSVATFEGLESRRALSVAPGLVPEGGQPTGPLTGRIVYTSAGHGWEYSDVLGRWNTDRGNLGSLVEDFGNQDQFSLYVDYVFRAGATVVPLRPVGRQLNEVVLDNDSPDVAWSGSWSNSTTGARWFDEDYGGPVDAVRYRFASVTAGPATSSATYAPTIPAAGLYPVYGWSSLGTNRTRQTYVVNHTGGSTAVSIDHRMVGNGWVYLGTYHFAAGRSTARGSVVITNSSTGGGSVVIADAIRFGNGMGDVPHGPSGIGVGSPSGTPREDENSLLWTWRSVGQGRDFTSPSAVVGTDNVSAPIRMAEDMNADTNPYGTSVYVGFHSNATTGSFATATARGAIGLIHSTSPTPNQAGLATRLARQINVDMRSRDGQFESSWSTRTTYTLSGSYGEISNARAGGEFDATIIEVGFHDQTLDNALLRDPRVRDQLARSVYEGTLEHFTDFPGTTSAPANVTLPSPPQQVAAVAAEDGSVTVSWVPGSSSAGGVDGVFGSPATAYRVEASINGLGFDGGTLVVGGAARSVTLSRLDPTRPHQVRVVAENAGGRSLASEVASVLPRAGRRQVLIVNGFDRIDKGQNFRQPYAYGGSATDRVWARFSNSRDYPTAVHAAIQAARPGVLVDSASNEAVVKGTVRLTDYAAVIWVLGTESTADRTFDATEQQLVETFLAGGGNLFVTGSDLAHDLDAQNNGRTFLRESVGVSYASGDANTFQVAAAAGGIFAGIAGFTFANGSVYSALDGQTYGVNAPDAFTVAAGTTPALVYAGGDGGVAGVHRQGSGGRGSVVAFGFPFEIITQPATRAAIMDRVLDAFAIQSPPMDLVVTVADGQTIVDSDARSGNVRLVKRGAGRLVIERANAFTGGTLIEDGEVVVRHVEALAAGSVTLRGQGLLTLDIGVERLSLPVLDMAATTRIDVGFGGLTIAAGGIAEDQLVALLRTARGHGDWAASPAGIGSAFAAAGSGRGVGFVRDESATMSVAFAAAGDVNLDGVVDILDVSALLADGGYDTATPAGWATGDFTFDGVVDILDVSELFAAAAFDAGSYLPSGPLTRRRIR